MKVVIPYVSQLLKEYGMIVSIDDIDTVERINSMFKGN